jgi:hypothetical protein
MPAGRNCRACGEPLRGDVRWCTLCYTPAWEYSPRAPLHRGDFVDAPRHSGRTVPHWSRWEQSATTFGPVGRIMLTVGFVLSVPTAWSFGMILYLVWAPVFGWFFLSSVWEKGWVVPDEPDLPVVPDRSEPKTIVERRTPVQTVFRVAVWAGMVAAILAFLQGPAEVKSAILMAVGFGLLYWVFRWSLNR